MLGKLIGAIIGYSMGGFLGLLIGLFLGHQLDKRVMVGWQVKHLAKVQQAFFEATFSVMGHLAKADGRVSAHEIAMARQVMLRMGLSEEAQHEAITLFNQGKSAEFDLEAVLQTFRRATLGRRNLIQMFIEIQLNAGYADGKLALVERDLLLKICNVLGFSVAEFERIDAMIQAEIHSRSTGGRSGPSLEDAYAILNIDEGASDSEVKKAYRRLTSQHHPDKLVAKGLPQEMMKLAEEKTHEIRSAYERIRSERGFK